MKLTSPKHLLSTIERRVFDQRPAAKALATALFVHIHAMKTQSSTVGNHLLLLGPTGSGKTAMAEAIRHTLNHHGMEVPIVIMNAPSYCRAGYKGLHIGDLVAEVMVQAKRLGNPKLARHAIILADEVDKIADRPDSDGADIAKSALQHEILAMMSGAGGARPYDSIDSISTDGWTWIGFGAFHGIRPDGAEGDEDWVPMHANLVDYGFCEEFAGRWSRIASLRPLKASTILKALQSPGVANPLQRYIKMFKDMEIVLEFSDDLLTVLANEAVVRGTGFRGVYQSISELMEPILYELPEVPGKMRLTLDGPLFEPSPKVSKGQFYFEGIDSEAADHRSDFVDQVERRKQEISRRDKTPANLETELDTMLRSIAFSRATEEVRTWISVHLHPLSIERKIELLEFVLRRGVRANEVFNAYQRYGIDSVRIAAMYAEADKAREFFRKDAV